MWEEEARAWRAKGSCTDIPAPGPPPGTMILVMKPAMLKAECGELIYQMWM